MQKRKDSVLRLLYKMYSDLDRDFHNECSRELYAIDDIENKIQYCEEELAYAIKYTTELIGIFQYKNPVTSPHLIMHEGFPSRKVWLRAFESDEVSEDIKQRHITKFENLIKIK